MNYRIHFGNGDLTFVTRGRFSEANKSNNNICRRRLLNTFPFLEQQNLYLRHLPNPNTVDIFLWNAGKMEVKDDPYDRRAIMDILRYAPQHDQPIVLYRGLSIDQRNKLRMKYVSPFSTTLLPEVSARFAAKISRNDHEYAVIMKIHVPAFTPFLWTCLTTQRYFCHQAEIILPPGSLEMIDQEWQTHVIDGLDSSILVMECVFNLHHLSTRRRTELSRLCLQKTNSN